MIQKNLTPKVFMISHLYPSNAREDHNSGIFIKTQITEYQKHIDINLFVPVDCTPNGSSIKQKYGFKAKLNETAKQLRRTIFNDLKPFHKPVNGKFIKFATIPPKSYFSYCNGIILFLRAYLEINNCRKFDIVHGQTILPDGYAAVLLSKKMKVPSIVTIRGSDLHSVKKSSLTMKTVKYVLNNADMITCVSSDLKNRAAELGIDEKKIKVVTNGIDLNFVNNAKLFDIKSKMKIDKNAKILLSVGRLVEVKSPFVLLKAFKQLTKTHRNIHLIFVGDGNLKEAIQNKIKTMEIEHCVHLVGAVPHSMVPSYMNTCEMLCMSSVREGWPNVLFEAMSFGKPIVASKVGGIPEAVCSEDYGYLFDSGDYINMAKCMDKALRKKWDHKKIEAWAQKNTWEQVGKKYAALYYELLNDYGTRQQSL